MHVFPKLHEKPYYYLYILAKIKLELLEHPVFEFA
jgi:hypothetical protein